jgi:hypothetical protein
MMMTIASTGKQMPFYMVDGRWVNNEGRIFHNMTEVEAYCASYTSESTLPPDYHMSSLDQGNMFGDEVE